MDIKLHESETKKPVGWEPLPLFPFYILSKHNGEENNFDIKNIVETAFETLNK